MNTSQTFLGKSLPTGKLTTPRQPRKKHGALLVAVITLMVGIFFAAQITHAAQAPRVCAQENYNLALNAPLFPIIPASLIEYDKPTGCIPALWERRVVNIFLLRGITTLSWLATATAIILSLYAGVLYLLDTSQPDNAKKAIKILKAVYTGLLVLLLSRFIISQTITTFGSFNPPDDKGVTTDRSPAAK
jgi:hypothetical protein